MSQVWIVLGVSILVAIIANRFILSKATKIGARNLSTLEVIAILLTRQLPKSFDVYSVSTKFFIIIVSFFALLISSNYTSGQQSQLSVIRRMRPISSFEELVTSRFPVLKSDILNTLLIGEAGKPFQAINTWKLPKYPLVEEALAYVAKGEAAYFDAGRVLKYNQFLKYTDSLGQSPIFIPDECIQVRNKVIQMVDEIIWELPPGVTFKSFFTRYKSIFCNAIKVNPPGACHPQINGYS